MNEIISLFVKFSIAIALATLVWVRIYPLFKGVFSKNDPKITKYYEMVYQRRALLTKHELKNYYVLRDIAERNNLLICPKVRLLDLLQPMSGIPNYRKFLYKVQSKHVDFVICDQDMNVLAVVELDDRSHLRADRQERDQFVDAVLASCGYKIIHTWAVTDNTLDSILGHPEDKELAAQIQVVHAEPTFEEWKEQQNNIAVN